MITLLSILGLYVSFGMLVGAVGMWVHLYQHLDDEEPVIKVMGESFYIFIVNTLTWPKIVKQLFTS